MLIGTYRLPQISLSRIVIICRVHLRCCAFNSLFISPLASHSSKQDSQHTAAGQILVIAISDFPSLTQSIAKPRVSTLIPTLPVYCQHCPESYFLTQRLTHSISRLSPEKPRINRRRNHHNPPLPPILLKYRQRRHDSRIQPLRIDPLHQLEPLERRIGNRRPPYRTRIVDQNIQPTTANTYGLVHQVIDLGGVAHIDLDGVGGAAGEGDFAGDGVDGGGGGVRVWWEGCCGIWRGG